MYLKGILSQLIDLDNGQTNFDLRLIALDLSTHKLLFSDVLDPQHLIVTTKIIFYMKQRNVSAIYLVFEASPRLAFKNRDVLYFSHVTRPGIPFFDRCSTLVVLTAFRLHGLTDRLLAAQHNYNFAIDTVCILFYFITNYLPCKRQFNAQIATSKQ